eukprot:scaffold96948_cov33-Tisochrysis_lutea.AAC.1
MTTTKAACSACESRAAAHISLVPRVGGRPAADAVAEQSLYGAGGCGGQTSHTGEYWTAAWPVPRSSQLPLALRQ